MSALDTQMKYKAGVHLSSGDLVEKDEVSAAQCFKTAANEGHSEGQYQYGLCLENGRGIEKDVAAATHYYRVAADQGHEKACRAYEELVSKCHLMAASRKKVDVCNLVVDMKLWEPVRVLGRGQFGIVELYRNMSTNELAAVKTLNLYGDNISNKFRREVKLLSCVDHPCALSITGIVLPTSDTSGPRIFSEFMEAGSLDFILQEEEESQSSLSHTDASIIIVGVAFGMEHIHSMNIIHRDLKPANVLLDKNMYPRIGDFGSGAFVDSGVTQSIGVGTPAYMAPEMYDETAYTSKIDVFSFGLLLYEVIFRKRGLSGNPAQIMMKAVSGKRSSLDVSEGSAAVGVNGAVIRLIEECWSWNPDDRPSFSDIVKRLASINFKLFDDVDEECLNAFVEMVRFIDLVQL